MIIHLNGEHLEADEAYIDITDRGFLLGDGLFETFRIEDGRVHALDAHLDRMAEGFRVRGISAPLSRQEFARRLLGTIAANGLRTGSARLTVTTGSGPRGLTPPDPLAPTIMITVAPIAFERLAPATLCIAEGTRRNERSPLSRIKSLNYLDAVLAKQEATAKGVDDAVMLNSRDRVAETSIANLFLLSDGIWRTPPVEEGALPGVVRGLVLTCAREMGLPIVETPLTRADLDTAASLVLTNSLIGLRPVARFEGRDLEIPAVLDALSQAVFR